MRLRYLVAAAAAWLAVAGAVSAQQETASAIDRLYALACGEGRAPDQSRWSPGVNVGQPLDLVDNCYLIHHKDGYLLWDTGITDAIAAMPEGQPGVNGATSWRLPKTLASQLAGLGVAPADIRYVAISHTHPDHIGNVELFSQAMLLVQKAEYEWPAPFGAGRFKPEHPVMKLEGDKDVFGDGSVILLSTPGHTPGHQSLLVHLAKTGWLVLSGDAVHFLDNWDHRRVPGPNFDKDKTLASLQRIADVMAQHHAQLWINHDKAQGDKLRRPPEFYE